MLLGRLKLRGLLKPVAEAIGKSLRPQKRQRIETESKKQSDDATAVIVQTSAALPMSAVHTVVVPQPPTTQQLSALEFLQQCFPSTPVHALPSLHLFLHSLFDIGNIAFS